MESVRDWMSKGTLIMMHGMTGTSEKMMPLARQLVPKGWNVLCPEAIIPHPTRGGFAWWLRSDDPTLPLNEKSLQQTRLNIQCVF